MDSSAASIAYGKALIELGLLPAERVRAMGQHCLQHGLDLRAELLRRGLIDATSDARAVALAQRATAADSSRTPQAGSDGGSGTRDSKGLLVDGVRLPEPGEVLGGCRIERELARGGMGAVYVAAAADGTPVALKVVLGNLEAGSRRARFEREAEIGENLRHPGIVKVLAHGEEQGLAYLVMELLEGARPLDEFVHAQQTPLSERVRLMIEICEALAAAHAARIFHRDLKPDNVLVLPDGAVRVVDFGLAKQLDRERLTQSGAVMGTLHYMAPEQVSGQTAHADARADVFALGVMLHELIRGERPFQGETGVEVMRKILEVEAPPLGKAVGELRALEDVVATALAKDPEGRYADAGALGRDLAAVLAGSAVSDAARGRRRRGRARRRAPLALALAAGAGLVGWLALRPPAPLDAAALSERVRALDKEAMAALRARRRTLVADAAEIEALLASLRDLERACERSAAAGGAVPRERVARARQRVHAALGLLALARGEEPGRLEPDADPDDPSALALNGAVAAVTTQADAAAAARALSSAIARGVARPEVIRWRATARVRAGFSSGADAEEVLEDLDGLGAGETVPADAPLRVAALLYLERPDEAHEVLQGIDDPSDRLRWEVALGRVALQVEPNPAAAIVALEGLPATGGDRARRDELARQAYALAADALAAVQSRALAPPRLRDLLRLGKLLAPERPLEPDLRDRLLDHVGRFGGIDFELGVALIELHPDDVVVQRRASLLAEQPTASPEQRRVFVGAVRRTAELTEDPDERQDAEVALCQLLNRVGMHDEVIQQATETLRTLEDPRGRSTVLMTRGRSFFHKRQYESALADLDESLTLHEVTVHQRPDRARVLMALGRREEALADALRYFDAADEHVANQSTMASVVWDVTREIGRDDLTRAPLEKYWTWEPAQGAAWGTRLAWLRLRDGEPEGAHQLLVRVVEFLAARGDRAAARARAAREALEAGDLNAAGARLDELVEEFDKVR